MVTSCRLFTFLVRWCWTLFTRRVLVLGRANVKCSLFTAWYCRLPQALVIWVDVGMSDCAIPKCFGIPLYPQNIIIYLIYWATNPIISPIRYIYIYILIYPQHYPYGIFVPQELKNGTCILAGAWGRQFDSLTVHIYRFRNSKLPTLNIPHTKMAIDNLHWFWGPKL